MGFGHSEAKLNGCIKNESWILGRSHSTFSFDKYRQYCIHLYISNLDRNVIFATTLLRVPIRLRKENPKMSKLTSSELIDW